MTFAVGEVHEHGLLVHVSDGFQMSSNWLDCVFIQEAESSFDVIACKWAENYLSPNEFVWHEIDRISGLRTGADLYDAISRCSVALSVYVEKSDVVDTTAVVFPALSKLLLDEILRREGIQ